VSASVSGKGSAGVSRADLVLASGALLIFAAALVQSTQWDFRTALFPRMVSVAGVAFTLLFLLTRLRGARRGVPRSTPTAPSPASPAAADPAAPAATGPEGASPQLVDEHGHEVEYVFATAGRAAWTQALGWVAVFLVVLFVGGLFVAAPVFAFSYLRWGAGRSWTFAVVYAVVLTALLYLFLQVLLTVPTPEGFFQ
jgi:hypothetical protein